MDVDLVSFESFAEGDVFVRLLHGSAMHPFPCGARKTGPQEAVNLRTGEGIEVAAGSRVSRPDGPLLDAGFAMEMMEVPYLIPPSPGGVTADNLPMWAAWLTCGAQEDASPYRYVDIIERLQVLSMGDDVAEVDAVLQFIDERRMSERSIITLVRTTFGFRSRLPHWCSFRDRAEQVLDARGRPARKILMGLYR